MEDSKKILEACRKALKQNNGCAPEVVEKVIQGLNEKSFTFTQGYIVDKVRDMGPSTPRKRRKEMEQLEEIILGQKHTKQFTTTQICTLVGAVNAYMGNVSRVSRIRKKQSGNQEDLAKVRNELRRVFTEEEGKEGTLWSPEEIERNKQEGLERLNKISQTQAEAKRVGLGNYAPLLSEYNIEEVWDTLAKIPEEDPDYDKTVKSAIQKGLVLEMFKERLRNLSKRKLSKSADLKTYSVDQTEIMTGLADLVEDLRRKIELATKVGKAQAKAQTNHQNGDYVTPEQLGSTVEQLRDRLAANFTNSIEYAKGLDNVLEETDKSLAKSIGRSNGRIAEANTARKALIYSIEALQRKMGSFESEGKRSNGRIAEANTARKALIYSIEALQRKIGSLESEGKRSSGKIKYSKGAQRAIAKDVKDLTLKIKALQNAERRYKRIGVNVGELGDRVTELEVPRKALIREARNAEKTVDRLVRKASKLTPRVGYQKRAGLIAALSALGVLGIYNVLGVASKIKFPARPARSMPKKGLIIARPCGKAYNLVELTKNQNYGEVLIADGESFYRNPQDKTDLRFFPLDAVTRMEAGEKVPGSKWLYFRTDEFKGGADVNKDGQNDLVDSDGNTYISHPKNSGKFMTGKRLRKGLLSRKK